MKGLGPAWLVLAVGVSAAMHVGKLPPAVPVLRDALGLTLVEAGFLLSLVQLAGMALGLAVGVLADRLGPRRTMVAGLAILGVAGMVGAGATSAAALLVLRACEGMGFLLATLPAPGLLRRVVEPHRLSRMLGMWGAYMPFGTALALLAAPTVMAATGWRTWWMLVAGLSLAMAFWMWRAIPAGVDIRAGHAPQGAMLRIRRTLGRAGPWLAAVAFAMYSAQWLSVIGFLPTIYAQAGVFPGFAAAATALAAAVNILGNVASGRLLHRGLRPQTLLYAGFTGMAAGALLAFAPWGDAGAAALRYAGVLVFSAVGGLVPGTLFSLAVRIAPDEGTTSTTVGWMQQWSSLGQFVGPPLVAAVAARTGGWQSTWWILAAFGAAGLVISTAIAALLARPAPTAPRAAP